MIKAILAVLYARVSSKEQEREGFSIPAQLKLLREYAARNGFTIGMEFVDIETAKSSGRHNFDEMVRFLRSIGIAESYWSKKPIVCTAISGTPSPWKILTWRLI